MLKSSQHPIAYTSEPGRQPGGRLASIEPPETLQSQTYRAILDAICDGALPPGERLTQERVAQMLNVSRQPVMQALMLLRQQGFVQDVGRRGLVVAQLDPAFLKAIYELREAIDPLAARLAAGRIGEHDAARGRALVEEGVQAMQAGELQALVRADMRFHTFLYDLSGNPLVPETMRSYWNHLRRSMVEVLRLAGGTDLIWHQHSAIIDAVAAGDANRAAALALEHLETAVQRLELAYAAEQP